MANNKKAEALGPKRHMAGMFGGDSVSKDINPAGSNELCYAHEKLEAEEGEEHESAEESVKGPFKPHGY